MLGDKLTTTRDEEVRRYAALFNLCPSIGVRTAAGFLEANNPHAVMLKGVFDQLKSARPQLYAEFFAVFKCSVNVAIQHRSPQMENAGAGAARLAQYLEANEVMLKREVFLRRSDLYERFLDIADACIFVSSPCARVRSSSDPLPLSALEAAARAQAAEASAATSSTASMSRALQRPLPNVGGGSASVAMTDRPSLHRPRPGAKLPERPHSRSMDSGLAEIFRKIRLRESEQERQDSAQPGGASSARPS